MNRAIVEALIGVNLSGLFLLGMTHLHFLVYLILMNQMGFGLLGLDENRNRCR